MTGNETGTETRTETVTETGTGILESEEDITNII